MEEIVFVRLTIPLQRGSLFSQVLLLVPICGSGGVICQEAPILREDDRDDDRGVHGYQSRSNSLLLPPYFAFLVCPCLHILRGF